MGSYLSKFLDVCLLFVDDHVISILKNLLRIQVLGVDWVGWPVMSQ